MGDNITMNLDITMHVQEESRRGDGGTSPAHHADGSAEKENRVVLAGIL